MSDPKLTLHLTISAAPGAPRVPLEVTADISAADLRKRASEATKIPLTALKLIFRGRMVANDAAVKAVTEYKLEDGSVVHCMGKPVQESVAASTAPVAATVAPTAASLPSVNLIPPAAAAAAPIPSLSSGDSLSDALKTIRAHNSPQTFKAAVETLQKLLAKIVENPLEEKYRRVKKENPAFLRKLGGLTGGDAAMKAAGFVVQTDESGQPVYQMLASADAWPKLLAAQTTVQNALQEAQAMAAPPMAPAALPGFPFANPGVGMNPNMMGGGIPPNMEQAAANLMSNPQALQAMLQSPMVQNMMRNDPRFANNPMARQMMESIFANPETVHQATQMMQDPNFRQQMQQLQQNPAMMQQMQSMFGGAGLPGGFPASRPPPSSGQQQQQQQANQPSDQDMTEEEMIAEAIRRSLQDNNNNNGGN